MRNTKKKYPNNPSGDINSSIPSQSGMNMNKPIINDRTRYNVLKHEFEELQVKYDELKIKHEQMIDMVYEEANRFFLRSGGSSDCKFIKNKLFEILEAAGYSPIIGDRGDPLPSKETCSIRWWQDPGKGEIIDVLKIGLKDNNTNEIRHLITVSAIQRDDSKEKTMESSSKKLLLKEFLGNFEKKGD